MAQLEEEVLSARRRAAELQQEVDDLVTETNAARDVATEAQRRAATELARMREQLDTLRGEIKTEQVTNAPNPNPNPNPNRMAHS